MRRGEEWVLAVGLLPAAPAGIAKDVDVGRPDVEAVVDAVVVLAESLGVLGAGLGGDLRCGFMQQRGVPCGSQTDSLREYGGVSGAGDAVQAFVPPVVLGDVEPRDRDRVILHLRDFFFERHLADEFRSALRVGVLVFDCAWTQA